MSVDKKDGSWVFQFTGDVTITTESSWRLFDDGVIAITSSDHGHNFGLPHSIDAAARLKTIAGANAVDAATISDSSGDLTVTFREGARLQLLQMSSGYESWAILTPAGHTICTGGGDVAHFAR